MKPLRCRALVLGAALIPLLLIIPGVAVADQSFEDKLATVRSFFEFAWGFTLDDAAVQAIRQGLAAEYTSNAVSTDRTVQKMQQLLDWQKTQPSFIQEYARKELGPRLVMSVNNDVSIPYAARYALVKAWLAHNPAIAGGYPPLTQEVVDAARALTKFIAEQTGQPVPALVADPDQYRAQVIAQYRTATPDQQLSFSLIVPLWYKMNYLWNQMSAADQNKFRRQLRSNANLAQSSNAGATTTINQNENFYNKVIAGPQAANIHFSQGIMEHFNDYGF